MKPNKKTNLEVNAPFLIQDMRFKDIEDIPGPGPGAYIINNTVKIFIYVFIFFKI